MLDLRQSTWQHHQEAGAKVQLTQSESNGDEIVRLTCMHSGRKSNHVQLKGPNVAVENETHLQLTLRVRSSIPFRLSGLEILKNGAPWTRYATAVVGREISDQWIEHALKRHVVNQGGVHHVVYDGLAVKYGAAHGFGGGSTHHIVIRNCDLAYIGGGHQFTHPNGVPVRYGNAIEFWGAASDHLVENCRIWEVYDAALTNQNKTATVRQENITYRNNVIWNCEYSFEYWNHPETSVTRNIRFVNNTCVNAGIVWSHAQRPNPNGSHLMFYSNAAATSAFEVKYNIFYQVSDWGSRYTGGWESLPEMDHNLWFSEQGIMAYWFRDKIGTFQDYQKTTGLDTRSIFADPRFVDPDNGDYRLAPDSPARKVRTDGGPVGAESLFSMPALSEAIGWLQHRGHTGRYDQ